jgi:hypothetical protein
MPRYQACREKLHGPIGSLNKPGGQFRGLDGPLDTDFLEPERLHCLDAL